MTVQAMREFNRYYTKVIGLLDYQAHMHSPYSLTETRVLYELAHREHSEAADLRSELSLDAGYLSRMLARFEKQGLIARERSRTDARRQLVRLTEAGRETVAGLEERSDEIISALLSGVSATDRARLTSAMRTVRTTLEGPERPRAYALREPAPGDLGWVVQRHGEVYAAEYGFDQDFEVLVARIVTDFGEHRDPARERAWIAEVDGEPAGCVFCVRDKEEHVARLRLLLVEPSARGLGIGARLVDECVRYARERGYRELRLWTNDVLASARRVYEAAGFKLTSSEHHSSWGRELVGQDWSLPL